MYVLFVIETNAAACFEKKKIYIQKEFNIKIYSLNLNIAKIPSCGLLERVMTEFLVSEQMFSYF